MLERLSLTVNGIKHTIDCEKNESLLDILRNRLDLTGTKEGCGYGTCGSCTVVLNGEAVTACTFRGKSKIDGSEVLTIEGLANDDGTLHQIQEAFIEAGAVQCGFCSPGFIMRLYALFLNNPNASTDEINEVLSMNLCRCTGYEAIGNAALSAQKKMSYRTE
jgi:carbon-monoxide dehydrogenase small subunit